jgi:hypothetical protein
MEPNGKKEIDWWSIRTGGRAVKAIRVDRIRHAQFKSECALRGVTMAKATDEALRALMIWWDMELPLHLSDFLRRLGEERLRRLIYELEVASEAQPD